MWYATYQFLYWYAQMHMYKQKYSCTFTVLLLFCLTQIWELARWSLAGLWLRTVGSPKTLPGEVCPLQGPPHMLNTVKAPDPHWKLHMPQGMLFRKQVMQGRRTWDTIWECLVVLLYARHALPSAQHALPFAQHALPFTVCGRHQTCRSATDCTPSCNTLLDAGSRHQLTVHNVGDGLEAEHGNVEQGGHPSHSCSLHLLHSHFVAGHEGHVLLCVVQAVAWWHHACLDTTVTVTWVLKLHDTLQLYICFLSIVLWDSALINFAVKTLMKPWLRLLPHCRDCVYLVRFTSHAPVTGQTVTSLIHRCGFFSKQ